MGSYDPSDSIRAAVLADPCVRSVKLIGPRADGTATELSDWDYHIAFTDAVATGRAAATRPRVEPEPPCRPVDPLSTQPVYLIVLPGAV